jgi:hypothetical protein
MAGGSPPVTEQKHACLPVVFHITVLPPIITIFSGTVKNLAGEVFMTGDRVESHRPIEQPPEADSQLASRVWMSANQRNEPGRQPESTTVREAALPPLQITDANHQSKTEDTGKNLPEANSLLMQAADQTVNQSIYRLPRWAQLPKPVPGLGCVSSFSNRYREALRLAGIIDSADDKRFRNYYWVNMDELNKDLGRDRLLQGVQEKEIKEGDLIEGVTPDTSKRHIGIVGRIENGERMVYDNYGGIWRKEPLTLRFGQYKEHHYFRAYLPSGS